LHIAVHGDRLCTFTVCSLPLRAEEEEEEEEQEEVVVVVMEEEEEERGRGAWCAGT
jgi:hypothetical protein